MKTARPSTDKCQLCQVDLRQFDTFYDGRVRGETSWVWMCRECWRDYGAGLGTGIGQEYDSKTDEKLRG